MTTSSACRSEKLYVVSWVLDEVYGIPFEIVWDEQAQGIKFTHSSIAGSVMTRDDFFVLAAQRWLSTESMPTKMKPTFVTGDHDTDETEVAAFEFAAVAQHEPRPTVVESNADGNRFIDFDLLGSLFFLISRYEEAVTTTLDDHDRFPSQASVLTRFELTERPIGNEYIDLLWRELKSLWPSLQRRERSFRVLPSHDMDLISADWKSETTFLRTLIGAARRADLTAVKKLWKQRTAYAKRTRQQNWVDDPNETIDWIMDQSEANGLTSAFYYIPDKTHRLDPGMPIDHPHVADQWRRIADRGHEIGMHPGYDTYDRPDRIQAGVNRIRQQLDRLSIRQDTVGGRQHFLRWKTPETAVAWDDAGMEYDSTLAFADQAGFRCGVCYEYPMYDLVRRRPLNLRQRPLVVMECTVIDDRYMGLGASEAAYECMVRLKRHCETYNGDFTILWHNQRFRSTEERDLYREVLSA